MTPGVPYWTYLPGYARERESVLAAVDRVFSSGRLILGESVARFERRFAAYCGVAHGIGVNSGTDALFLALKALGVASGDEVITVANTAVPTVAAIRATGARPVFVDVSHDTFLMNANLVEEQINTRTRCILPVHLFGQLAPMPQLQAAARRHGIVLLEDCAQAAGADHAGQKAGAWSDISAFSFYPTKLLGGFGDGGMMLANDEPLASRLRRLRFYGMERNYYAEEEGYNSRLDEVQAAILDERLDRLEDYITARRRIAAHYDREIGTLGDVVTPAVAPGNRHAYYVYTIRTPRRDALRDHLTTSGIGTQINYPTPIHLMRGYAFLGYRAGDLPETERAQQEMLSLPMYPELTDDQVEMVVRSVRSFFTTG